MPMSETLLLEYMCQRYGLSHAVPYGRAACGIAATLAVWRGRRKNLKVALPAMTCHDLLAAVLAAGCEPIFCDIELDDGNVAADTWSKAIARGAEVVIFVHSFGNPSEGIKVRALCDVADVLMIDDAAQALGANRNGVLAGTCGHIGVFSFGATKHIDVGGAVLLYEDESLASEAQIYASNKLSFTEAQSALALNEFRERYFRNRYAVAEYGEERARLFLGLLDKYTPALWRRWNPVLADEILQRLASYQNELIARRKKASKWDELLAPYGVVPVGMTRDCAPWRYTCRLPKITWSEQHRISERVRMNGSHISNWYSPLPWFVGQDASGTVPKTVQFSREVFQFWVTSEITSAAIQAGARRFGSAVAAMKS